MADPASEVVRKHFAEWYSTKTEDELRKLADDAWTLTEPAKDALRTEVSRRSLSIELCDLPPAETPLSAVVTIRRYRDLPNALLAKSALDSAGIECFLFDENLIRMDWLWSNAIGGVKLCVRQDDMPAALALLDQGPTEKFDSGDSGEYKQPRCPCCGSLDVSFGDIGKCLSYVTIALGVPLPVKRGGWKCHSCGHVWYDSEDSQQETPSKPQA